MRSTHVRVLDIQLSNRISFKSNAPSPNFTACCKIPIKSVKCLHTTSIELCFAKSIGTRPLSFYRDDHSLRGRRGKGREKGCNYSRARTTSAERGWRGRAHYQAIVSGVFYFRQNRDWSELLNIFLVNNQTVCYV